MNFIFVNYTFLGEMDWKYPVYSFELAESIATKRIFTDWDTFQISRFFCVGVVKILETSGELARSFDTKQSSRLTSLVDEFMTDNYRNKFVEDVFRLMLDDIKYLTKDICFKIEALIINKMYEIARILENIGVPPSMCEDITNRGIELAGCMRILKIGQMSDG